MTTKAELQDQPLTKNTRTPPTTAQILAQQKADSERERAERETALPETKQELLASALRVPAATSSEEALERHLSQWGGSGGRLIGFNGSTGIHRTLDDGVEMPSGTEFVAFLHETQRGFIKFNEGAPPDVRMVSISEDAELPRREELGDLDQSKWPRGLDDNRQDPWKEQIAIPLAPRDAGSELFVYVARGPLP